MTKRAKVIAGLEKLRDNVGCIDVHDADCKTCPYKDVDGCCNAIITDALALLKAQEQEVVNLTTKVAELQTFVREPRVMTREEVEAMPYGHVLIETDKNGSLRWLDALMFCKNANFSFDFITLEGRARLLGAEYNREWRCWTSRPTDEQREAVKWE